MYTKKTRIGWPFFIAAILIMIFGMDITWWHAILVCFLAAFYVEVETSGHTGPVSRQQRNLLRHMR